MLLFVITKGGNDSEDTYHDALAWIHPMPRAELDGAMAALQNRFPQDSSELSPLFWCEAVTSMQIQALARARIGIRENVDRAKRVGFEPWATWYSSIEAAIPRVDFNPHAKFKGKREADDQGDPNFVPSQTHLDIEDCLKNSKSPLKQVDIAAKSGYSKNTVVKCLNDLEMAGRVIRPSGARSGYILQSTAKR